MKLRNGELKVFYQHPKGIDVEFDKAIEKFLAEYGYNQWASGTEICTGVRDLAFEAKSA